MTPSVFTLEDTARRLGHYAWAEARTFEVVGGWVPSVPEPSIKARLAAHANGHAWHAELWHRRFPELREMGTDEFVAPANEAVAAFFDALEAAATTLARVVGVGRVLLPHLVATYTFHRNRASEISDGPIIRSLDLVVADDLGQIADSALILGSLIEGRDDLDAAAAHQVGLEACLVEAGGIAGPNADAETS